MSGSAQHETSCESELRAWCVDGPLFRANQLSTMSVAKRAEVMPYVRLLCEQHSNEALYNAGQVTHGTWYAAYKKKCRCEECGEYMADYNIRRQEDRRYAKQAQV